MNYSNYSAEELALDTSFQNWVKRLNQADIQYWENWIIAHPEKETVVNEASALVAMLQMSKQTLSEEEVEEEIRQVRRKMEAVEVVKSQLVRTRSLSWTNEWMRYAAVFAGFLLVASVVVFFLIQRHNQSTFATKFGEIKEVQLPDGSRVILSGNSQLKISQNWVASLSAENGNGKAINREVWLDGMAYFKVSHLSKSKSEDQPIKFIVHASGVNVEVIGTEFNVSNRGEKVKVVLNSGKVQLRINENKQQRQLSMKPGDFFEWGKKDNAYQQKQVNTQKYTSWKEGELRFENTSLQEIAGIMEEAYGYPVIIQPKSLSNRQVTGVIQNRDLSFLLHTLSTILGIEALQENGQIILREPVTLE